LSRSPSRPTRVEDAVAVLREEIVTGRLKPLTPLRLQDLAQRLDMSMMPVREALRSLEALGLVEHSPRRGARVSSFSVEDLYDTYEARLALETLAIQRAAERFTDEDERVARAHLEEHVDALLSKDTSRSRATHTAFHFALYSAAQSSWLLRLIRPLWENSERYRILSLASRGTIDMRREEHDRILAACVRGNPRAAARELHQHLALTANLVARHFHTRDLF
jgi:DNA-binding GntR family transcriptional regulator